MWLTVTLVTRSAMGGPIEDFFALEDQIVEAHETYLESVEALKTKSKSGAVGKTKPSVDRRPAILERMDALSTANAKTPDGAIIAVGTFLWCWNLDLDLDHLADRFERLAREYPNEPVLEDAIAVVAQAAAAVGSTGKWAKALEGLVKRTNRKPARLGALYALGEVRLGARQLSFAKAAFKRVLEVDPESDLADAARGSIFEIDHLQIGMTAPEFTAQTLDGKEVSLESLRGKAVLLNLWATW